MPRTKKADNGTVKVEGAGHVNDGAAGNIEIRAAVARSNPMVMRGISIPAFYSVKELLITICGALGLPQLPGRCLEEPDENCVLKTLFEREDRLTLLLEQVSGKAVRSELCVYADLYKKNAKGTAIPVVTAASDLNLPQDVRNMRDINHILSYLSETDAVPLNGNLYTRHDLAFQSGKAENAMRRFFAPDTARKEVDQTLKLPLKQLLEGCTVEKLKRICDDCGIYYDSTMRKPAVVNAVYRKADNAFLKRLFDEMFIYEFENLRAFALGELKDKKDEELENALPNLIRLGLLCRVKGKGYMVASEVMDSFEDIYNSDNLDGFMKKKRMNTAMAACALLYGIFDRRMFGNILTAMEGGSIEEESRNAFFDSIRDNINSLKLTKYDTDTLYLFGLQRNDVERIRSMQLTRDEAYIPSREETEKILARGIFLTEENDLELLKLLNQNSGYYYFYDYHNSREIMGRIAAYLHYGEETDVVADYFMRYMHGVRWQSKPRIEGIKNSIKAILEREKKLIPLAELRGFSLTNCPKEMKKQYMEKRNTANGEKVKKGPGRNIKKAVAVKKR